MEEQGCDTIKTILLQDNKSAMLLEENGKQSLSKRTRHINIRYFFITDCIKCKEFKIDFCPTDEMWADFLTKPLQGKKFTVMRQVLMNLGSKEQVERQADSAEKEK